MFISLMVKEKNEFENCHLKYSRILMGIMQLDIRIWDDLAHL